MAKEFSFDVVSKADLNEVRNAVNMAQKEIATRYDFKKSVSKVTLEGDALVLVSDNEGKLRQVVDVLEEKLVRRKVPVKAIQYGKVEEALGGTVRQRAPIAQGIPEEKAKAMNRSRSRSRATRCGCSRPARTSSRPPWGRCATRTGTFRSSSSTTAEPRPPHGLHLLHPDARLPQERSRLRRPRGAALCRRASPGGSRPRRGPRRQHLRLHRHRQGGVDRSDPGRCGCRARARFTHRRRRLPRRALPRRTGGGVA